MLRGCAGMWGAHREGFGEAKPRRVAPVAPGYSHDGTQLASRLGALDPVGLHQGTGNGLLAGLQAAV